jgi:hypothetical protein
MPGSNKQYLDVVLVDGIRYVSREKRLLQKLLETSRFTLLPCEGTYFQEWLLTLQFLLKMM